jgi:hypothetical protein
VVWAHGASMGGAGQGDRHSPADGSMGAAGVEGELGLSRRRAHVVAAYRRHRLEPPPPEVHSRWQVRRRPLRLFCLAAVLTEIYL